MVIGGKGFIGSAVMARLPSAISYDLVDGQDVCNEDTLMRYVAGCDAVVHLASLQFHSPDIRTRGSGNRQTMENRFNHTNVEGIRTLLRVLESAAPAARLVYVSSDMVYGPPQTHPVMTDHPIHPVGLYGRTKAKADRLCQERGSVVIRPRFVGGPGRMGVLGPLYLLLDRGFPLPLPLGGKFHYQMIHVADLADLIVRACLDYVPGVYHAATDRPWFIRDMLSRLAADHRRPFNPVSLPWMPIKTAMRVCSAAGFPLLEPEQYELLTANMLLDIKTTVRTFDWQPRFSDYDVLESGFEWFLKSRASV